MSAAKKPEAAIVAFATAGAWSEWLAEHHGASPGVWLALAKKKPGAASLTYPEALEVALTWGWIDGPKKSRDDVSWLQKFTPRRAKSIWSKINRDKALALIEAGTMRPAGLAEVERAKGDGRWDAAYDPQSRATIPADLAAALAASPRAAAFFATLGSGNRYAILFRIQTAKKAETRVLRIARFVEMLERHETLHP